MEQMIDRIKSWPEEASEKVRSSQQTLTISQKSNRTDPVTNVDRNIQNFLIEKTHPYDSEAKILTEEGRYNQLTDLGGRVFVTDPTDGASNLVIEGENFCIMLAVHKSGVGKLGFIYDVTRNEFFWGGEGIGVHKNDKPMPKPANKSLSEGLLGVNNYLFGHNKHGIREVMESSMGTHMYGCAGFEPTVVLKGNHIAHISNPDPWDYVARNALLEEFGMVIGGLFGTPLTFDKREYYLARIPCAYVGIADPLKREGWKKVENIHKDDKNGQKINFLEKVKAFYYVS